MRKLSPLKYVVVALLVFTGAFTLHDNMLGKTLSNAFVPGKRTALEAPETAPVAAHARVGVGVAGQLYFADQINFKRLDPLPPALIDTETLWLARCIFSESKRKEEQELIAWVVRNRVETRYRGKRSYEAVVLDPMQFSAFNPGTRTRMYYASLSPHSSVPGWQTALRIAYEVRLSDPSVWRPFSARTRHFYSEQSMVGSKHPEWASGMKPVDPLRPYRIEPHRFRFYEGVW